MHNRVHRLFLFTLSLLQIVIFSTNRVWELNKNKASEDKFRGSCGIIAGTEMSKDDNGNLTLYITVKNISHKNINGIRIYLNSADINEEKLKRDFLQICDNTIAVGDTVKIIHKFADNETEKTDVYIYSVDFEDGSEWGDKAATESEITQKSYKLNIVGVNR